MTICPWPTWVHLVLSIQVKKFRCKKIFENEMFDLEKKYFKAGLIMNKNKNHEGKHFLRGILYVHLKCCLKVPNLKK